MTKLCLCGGACQTTFPVDKFCSGWPENVLVLTGNGNTVNKLTRPLQTIVVLSIWHTFVLPSRNPTTVILAADRGDEDAQLFRIMLLR